VSSFLLSFATVLKIQNILRPDFVASQRESFNTASIGHVPMTRALARTFKQALCRRCLTTLSENQYNAFVSGRPRIEAPATSSLPLHNRTIAIKDNICTKGQVWHSPEIPQSSACDTSCASLMLNGTHSSNLYLYEDITPRLRRQSSGYLKIWVQISSVKQIWMSSRWGAQAPTTSSPS
jgi:hypothetical protein